MLYNKVRSNLSKSNKNVSKELYNSLGYDLNVSKNSFSLSILNGRLWGVSRQGG
jgi:hypothetical protein